MSLFLRACQRQPTPHTPIWLMRQAGRYQPEYRALRQRVGFVELCKDPQLAAETTVLAARQLGVDAAIVFADILLILEPLGVGFRFSADDGPVIDTPVRQAQQVDAMPDDIDAASSLSYVMRTVALSVAELGDALPVIGFAGAPFTLASYLIEGGASRAYLHTKTWMYSDEGSWHALMRKLVAATVSYLRAQVAAGASAVQLFDSWVGCLSPADYARYVLPHMRTLFAALPPEVPSIHFSTGNPALLPLMRQAGSSVIGLDWRIELGDAWDGLGAGVAVMGNLDPAALLAPRPVMQAQAEHILRQAVGRRGHIFNLGHGIMPSASVEQVRALVDFVHERSAQLQGEGKQA